MRGGEGRGVTVEYMEVLIAKLSIIILEPCMHMKISEVFISRCQMSQFQDNWSLEPSSLV